MIQTYSIESVIAGVGWLSTKERLALRNILGNGGSIHFDQANKQVHLYWRAQADTIDSAMDASRDTLRNAALATGVFSPRTSFYAVREIDQ